MKKKTNTTHTNETGTKRNKQIRIKIHITRSHTQQMQNTKKQTHTTHTTKTNTNKTNKKGNDTNTHTEKAPT